MFGSNKTNTEILRESYLEIERIQNKTIDEVLEVVEKRRQGMIVCRDGYARGKEWLKENSYGAAANELAWVYDAISVMKGGTG